MKQPSSLIAIDILSKLQDKVGPARLVYWITPNTILTLSGARGYCDGVFYGPEQELHGWVREIKDSIETIRSITDIYFAEAKVDKTDFGDCAGYELVLKDGLGYSLAQSDLLNAQQAARLLKLTDGKKLQDTMISLLKSNPKLKSFDEDSLGHIGFGMVLGYPEKATLNSVSYWKNDDPFAEALISADIRGANYYDCPQPIYHYPRRLINNSDIHAHEELWSTILKDFYTSDFHKALVQNPTFQQKAKTLGIIRLKV